MFSNSLMGYTNAAGWQLEGIPADYSDNLNRDQWLWLLHQFWIAENFFNFICIGKSI